jgi:MOSC domain-containing protein YiiM
MTSDPIADASADALTPRLLTVNVGLPRRVDTGRRTVLTAIWKSPVDGRVAVRGVNLEGDAQADRKVHGGPDKALYAYAIEETRAWEDELGRSLGPGAFGENLTVEGLDVSGALIGERWRVGTTLLEVVQPRLPCFKLGLRMQDPSFVKRFGEASRPGAYLRIVEEGELGSGDQIEVDTTALPDHGVTVRMVSDAILLDHDLIPEVLDAPQLIPSLREWMTGVHAGRDR